MTGQYNCIYVENGAIKNSVGECDQTQILTDPNNEPLSDNGGGGTPTDNSTSTPPTESGSSTPAIEPPVEPPAESLSATETPANPEPASLDPVAPGL